MQLQPTIFGVSGLELNEAEIALFKQYPPLGFILFARNIENPTQVKALTAQMRGLFTDYQPLILIDQEGGRVARLREPHFETPPAPQIYADMVAQNGIEIAGKAAYEGSSKIAKTLTELGINVNCTPMCDVRFPDSHNIIGDRAYGTEPNQIIALSRSTANGLLDNNVLPIIKHIPGHGRALVDSHESLPIVKATMAELQIDFAPFKALNDLPFAMTAHILYEAIDAQNPATLSAKAINLIRTEIGFSGLIMSDDLCMKALGGTPDELAIKTLGAGCDIVLHCNGEFEEIQAICKALDKNYAFDKEKINAIYKKYGITKH
jgi:beta-N-acetylhexosaminidase